MPDGCRAPVWFLTAFVNERFSKLSKLKKYDIAALNNVVSKAVHKSKNTDILNNNCAKCMRQFSAKSIPTQCIYCNKYYHKSSCLPTHSSLCQQRSSSPTAVSTASSSLVRAAPTRTTATSIPGPGASTGSSQPEATTARPLKRPRSASPSTMIGSTPPDTRVPTTIAINNKLG